MSPSKPPESLSEDHVFGDSELSRLQDLVTKQLTFDGEVKTLEQQLKDKKKELNEISMTQIPDFLSQFGLSEIRLKSGQKVRVKADVSVTVKDWKAFVEFLKKRKDDAIVKNLMTVEDPTDEMMDELIDKGIMFDYESKVHPQTLKAYFREFLELGESPPDSVGLYTYSKTYIK